MCNKILIITIVVILNTNVLFSEEMENTEQTGQNFHQETARDLVDSSSDFHLDLLREFQEISPKNKFGFNWVNFGLGGGFVFGEVDEFGGSGGLISLAFGSIPHLIEVRALGVGEIEYTGMGSAPKDEISDLGILYCHVFKGRFGFTSLGTGLSVVRMSECDGMIRPDDHGFTVVKTTTLGVPIQAQAVLTPGSKVGFGLEYHANVIPKGSYHAIYLTFMIRGQK